jgi:hypothetical protein
MRDKSDIPAVCPHCQTSFESAGKNRYYNLKRHIESVHPIRGANTAKVGGPGIANNGDHAVNVNITLNIQTITKSDYTALLAGLKDIIKECIDSKKPMIPEMMSVLHETNANIVVPNKNKNEVLAKTGEERIEVLPIAEGVKICVKAFISDGIPKVQENLDDTPESSKCRERLEKEKTCPVDVEESFTKKLKNQNPKKRKDIVKKLYDDEGQSTDPAISLHIREDADP